ncbi:DUF3489 domain-containing protein [Mesorhizobium sp. Root157]|uniref:DUF3489 domain-containing protein n=1 Tax=Mesorhizobium sp. Root157 TaxID=1736477 RepID=UPI0009E7D053|nr:DUF3489 domain-containing protein [Mesorhizobium sp. Root157]
MVLTHSGNADLASRRDETAPSNPQSADSPSTKKTAPREKSPVTPIGTPAIGKSKPKTTTVGSKAQTKSGNKAGPSKTDLVLKKLRTTKGTTLAQLVDLTGWQQHSVRGFLSGTVRKKLDLNLVSEMGKDGTRRYRVIDDVAGLVS